jgi:thiol-disulfide isomerase/thioredoxin
MEKRPFTHISQHPSYYLLAVILCGFLLTGLPTQSLSSNQTAVQNNGKNTLYFFWGQGCPHCAAAKPFLEELKKKYPGFKVSAYEVYNRPENLEIMRDMAKSLGTEPKGVPTFFYGERVFVGFSENIAKEIEFAVSTGIKTGEQSDIVKEDLKEPEHSESVTIPLLGKKDAQSLSLPLFTVIIAGLDSFNPCAFFVLFTLLSLLVHAHSRKRMFLIGGVFVFFSGCIYFLFMATWLNLYFIIGHLAAVTYVAGILALIISLINIKDYFFFKKGLSLSISEASKPKLFERMRGLLRTESLPSVLAGSAVLAITANSYELLCTAGFPMVYTRVLTLNALSSGMYYAYLTLYNLIYVLPLAGIVVFFIATLGSRKLTEWQGRVLKLLSGLMMFCLALVLLINPALLQNAMFSVLLLIGITIMTSVVVLATKKHFSS